MQNLKNRQEKKSGFSWKNLAPEVFILKIFYKAFIVVEAWLLNDLLLQQLL